MSNVDQKKRTARMSISTYPDSKEAMKAYAAHLDIPLASALRMLINEAFRARGFHRVGNEFRKTARHDV